MKKGVSFLLYTVKISSLFKDKAYAFSQTGNTEDDCHFASKVLEKIEPNFDIKNINLLGVYEHFDVYSIIGENNEHFKLKISLSDPQKVLSREVTALRRLSKTSVVPKHSKQGKDKVGEAITYLLTKAPHGENIRNYGRSVILQNLDKLLENYFELGRSRNVRSTYKSIITPFLEQSVPSKFLPTDSLEAFKEYTDYDKCETFLINLKEEMKDLLDIITPDFKHKCHGALSLDSVFFNGENFYFDDLHNVCMGHPFLDFADLMLESGVPKDMDYELLQKFCRKGEIEHRHSLYNSMYYFQLRKKLAELIINYITEIYIYDSYRYEKILEIADTFSHNYERFCKVEIFKEHREFIMKTICEPIFGVKA